MRIYLIGLMGAGKSHWGPLLAREAGLRFFDLDLAIEESQGQSVEDFFVQQGEEAFRMVEKELLYLLTESHPAFVMACGGGTPCFLNNIDYMKQSGKVIWINPPVDILTARLRQTATQRPLLNEVPSHELAGFLQKMLAHRRLYYEQADLRIEEEALDLNGILKTLADV